MERWPHVRFRRKRTSACAAEALFHVSQRVGSTISSGRVSGVGRSSDAHIPYYVAREGWDLGVHVCFWLKPLRSCGSAWALVMN